jgi:predicted amidophosphoribosyltransferase
MSYIDLTVDPPRVLHKCSICLDLSESPYWLGCHVFCKSCISDWVLTSATCPTCRVKIPDELVQELVPRRSARERHATVMFTTNGHTSSTVTSLEMMERVDHIDN